MKINGNIVSCAGNFALRARCKWRGELRTPCSLQGCAGNFALRARCKWRREAFEKPVINTLPIKGITHYTLTITH